MALNLFLLHVELLMDAIENWIEAAILITLFAETQEVIEIFTPTLIISSGWLIKNDKVDSEPDVV
jgi:hypothetical protein